ncbi:MAG: hypothetical protein AAF502_25690 [Bacteroidota bacterium]
MTDLESRLLEIFKKLPEASQRSFVQSLAKVEELQEKIKKQEEQITHLPSDSLDEYNRQVAKKARSYGAVNMLSR